MRNSHCLLSLVSWHFLKSESCFFCVAWCPVSAFRQSVINDAAVVRTEQTLRTKNATFLISEAMEDLQQDRGNISDLVLFGICYLAQNTKYWYTPQSTWPKFKEQIWKVDMKKDSGILLLGEVIPLIFLHWKELNYSFYFHLYFWI